MSFIRYLAPPSVSFAPEDYVIWLDANDLGTITDTVDGVSQWNDKSGADNHVYQILTLSQRPTLILNDYNSKPAVSFDKAAFTSMTTELFTTNWTSNRCSAFTVMSWTDSVDSGQLVSTDSFLGGNAWDSNHRMVVFWWYFDEWTGAANNVYPAGVDLATSTPGMLSHFLDGTNQYLSINGVDSTPSTQLMTGMDIDRIRIGAGWPFYNVTAKLYELMIFNRNLTTEERQYIEGYLSWKWALDGSFLPIGHPYKSSAPV